MGLGGDMYTRLGLTGGEPEITPEEARILADEIAGEDAENDDAAALADKILGGEES
jgi:hypothetical protein